MQNHSGTVDSCIICEQTNVRTVVNVRRVVLFIQESVGEANMRRCRRECMSLTPPNRPVVGGNTFGHDTQQHTWFVFQAVCIHRVRVYRLTHNVGCVSQTLLCTRLKQNTTQCGC